MAQNLDFNSLIPSYLKNETLTSLVSNLFNRFVSQEDTLLVTGRIGTPVAGDAQIQARNIERQENALIPGLIYEAGREKFIFTFEDFINKLTVLDVDTINLRSWIAEQSFNYSPPIDYDKFVNYTNYYWVGKIVNNNGIPVWNQDLDPEYYVIERPQPGDLTKMPVKVATTRNVNLWINDRPTEKFTFTFTSSTEFVVDSDLVDGVAQIFPSVDSVSGDTGEETEVTIFGNDGVFPGEAPAIDDADNVTYPLFEMTIINGSELFEAGDTIVVTVDYFTSNITFQVNSPNMIGKGTVSGIATLSPRMFIDGVQVSIGDRVLVKDQDDPSENGIYIVTQGSKWPKDEDSANLVAGSRIYVLEGDTYEGYTFQVTSSSPLEFDSGTDGLPLPVNEWQQFNFWYHKDDLSKFSDIGIDVSDAEQARRPIIEYSRHVQLNAAVDIDGNPADVFVPNNIQIKQNKTRFNQIPQFDLFRYDGTHAGKTSGIWYYVEDPNFNVDSVLKKRTKLTANIDYVFGCAVKDELGRLLHYKDVSKTKNWFQTIWQPGVSRGTVSTPIFIGSDPDSEGSIVFNIVNPIADQQQWTITFVSSTEAEVVGTRSGYVGNATVNTLFAYDDFQITILNGSNPYVVGDAYTFNMYSVAAPRYVTEDDDGNIINYPGGIAADLTQPEPIGTWLTPGRMFQNMYRETRNEIAFGDFLNHARSVIRWQDGFEGASFGNNNSRDLSFDPGLGGKIKEFSSNFPLLSSMFIEQDISPLSIISFAERQYQTALASIDQFIIKELPGYLAQGGQIETAVIDPTADDIVALEQYFEDLRCEDVNLTTTFDDTTALVANWPATLPMLGVGLQTPVLRILKHQPEIVLDDVYNTFVIKHHDGHISPLAQHDSTFNRTLAMTVVPRSDGTSTPGIISSSTPTSPYARQLWFNHISGQLSVFDVSFDTEEEPTGTKDGEYWFQRNTGIIYEWDANAAGWILSSETVTSRWIPFSPENLRNSLVLAVEQKLYDSVHPAQHMTINLGETQSNVDNDRYMELELASFAAKYGYDAYAPDYDPANAFTWNYSQASLNVTLPAIFDIPKFKARWNVLYLAYFGSFGGVSATNRPDLYPWRLGTDLFPAQKEKPAGWDAAYKGTVIATGNTTSVRVVVTAPLLPPFEGFQTHDGITLAAGDKVLLTNQPSQALNGIYVISAGSWVRGPESLVNGLTISVLEGEQWAGSTWVLTTPDPISPEVTALTFEQSRPWSSQMWTDIQAHHPTLKLCVNTSTDALLPPYVSSTSFFANNALTNTIPTGANLGYEFGQFGPIEQLWTNSLEYRYGQLRTYFRQRPLDFLNKGWGDTYIRVEGLPIERNTLSTLPSEKFLLHGERLHNVYSYSPAEAKSRIKASSITWGSEFGGVVKFEVTHVASSDDESLEAVDSLLIDSASGSFPSDFYLGRSATVFSVFVNNEFVGYALEGWAHNLSHGTGSNNISFTDLIIDDLGIPFELGDTLEVTFKPNTITVEIPTEGTDFVYGALGCEGCVADATPDPTAIVTEVEHQPTYKFTSGQSKLFKGFGQWFTNLLRFSYIDEEVSTSTLAYRGWAIKLVHRLGALIRPNSLTINSASGQIPETGYSVVLKRSSQTNSFWISALRVQLVQMGSKKLNSFGKFVPVGAASDWIFRVEVYNNSNPQVDYNVLDTGGPFTEFMALNGETTDVSWKRYSEVSSTATTTMPVQITGLQNVLNFVYGYISQLEELGFKINETDVPLTDEKTGRNIDWQLEVEKLVDTVYSGMEAGQGVILNPFMDKLYLQTPVGLLGRYSDSKFLDPYSSQACYDVTSAVIPLENLSVVRTDPQAITYSSTPIFSAHLFTDEYEHAILLDSNHSSDPDSKLIFDQFLGFALNSAFLSYSRQNRIDSKPTLDGFFLNGDDVLRNPSSNIDALANAYDPSLTFNESPMSSHALSLVGFQPKQYFKDINVTDQVQLDFWRGMINAKGTNLTINAFTNFKKFFNSSIDEFWAYKLATYGDLRERSFPEIKISPNDCSRQFTGIQFYSSNDSAYTALPLFMQVEAFDDTRWFSIDDLGTILRFDSQAISETVEWEEENPDFSIGSHYVQLTNVYHNGDTFNPTAVIDEVVAVDISDNETVLDSSAYTITVSVITAEILKIEIEAIPAGLKALRISIDVSGYTWINRTKLSPIKLFDYSTDTLVDQIGLWHPAIGIHTPEALEVVNISSDVDPAHYNYTTQTTDNPNYATLKPWNEREVGRVWWDTSKLAYVPYYDALIFPNRETRHSRWGSLAEYASVDLYQWTESDYHPSEYDEVAARQEGDSSIDESIRLSGEVGFVNYYKAEREVSIRPIAWAQKDFVGDFPSHVIDTDPVRVYRTIERIVLEEGRLADTGITEGRRFGAWLNNKPHGEAIIGSDISYEIDDADRSGYGAVINTDGSDLDEAYIEQIPNSAVFGTKIGVITLADNSDLADSDNEIYKLRMLDSTGFYQDVIITDWTTQISGESILVIPFDQFGIQIVVKRSSGNGVTIDANAIITGLVDGGTDIYIRETVNYTSVVTFPSGTEIASNDPDDNAIVYGWRVWDIPTQAELNEDLPGQKAKWKPYLGDLIDVNVTPAVVKDMKNSSNSLRLISGVTIKRYETEWSNWEKLTTTKKTIISDGWLVPQFILENEEELDPNRLSVYANGVQLSPSSLVISDNTVRSVNILPEGTNVHLLYRPYQPTDDELAFDPNVQDDFQVQTWYKVDYQYTKRTMRDSSGNIVGTKYYFWVKNKTIPQAGKKMSLAQATDLLQYGNPKYMIFSRLVSDSEATSGAAYDSCAISGLGTSVTKTNAYKLRFLRDFTLRDDPEELKLKNVHTEWQLIRQNQSAKIPRQLWDSLTNAICGQDAVGNPLPSQTRINYDLKYGTRTRYGFERDQIFVESDLALDSVINAILNTSLTIDIGSTKITDYITALGINSSTTEEELNDKWFPDAETSRATMSLIYSSARANQVNEIFFNVLHDALANNYEFTDLFKTSMITVNASTIVDEQKASELSTEFF